MIITDLFESHQTCPECGGPSFSDLILAEKKDACYYKVKASAKVWPSAYASGRLVQCRKKGADNYGNSKNEGVMEMDKSQTPPGRDGSNDSDAGKKEYTAKATTAKKVAQDAEKILNKELNKKKGMAEGFPHDVDHMPGPVIRNADMTTDNVKTKDQAEWDRATDSINARVFDDMSEFRTDSKGETVVGDSAVWAKWDNATQTGWFNAKGRPLKPWPVKEQGVAEDQLAEKSVSQAQFRTMAAAAHNPKFAKKVGISPAVAKEFHSADKNSNYKKLPDRTTEGEVEKTKTGMIHRSSGAYGGGEAPRAYYDPGKYAKDIDHLDKGLTAKLDKSMGIKWPHGNKKSGMDEGEQQKGADYRDPPEADYGDDYQDMVARVKKLAGLGPLKTVYDPARRVYRNVPTAQQPKK